jgi:F-type H+-transporting ATPase subunit b
MDGLLRLGFDGPTIIAQAINFIILLVLLYFVAYKPLMKMLDERSSKIKENMAQAENTRHQAVENRNEARRQLEDAEKAGQNIISQATRNAETIKEKARQDAHTEALSIIDRAQEEIQKQKDDAVEEVRKEFANLTIQAAEKVIERSLDKEKHLALIEKTLEASSIAENNKQAE